MFQFTRKLPQYTSCVAVNPVGLWPLTDVWGVTDVQGDHDGMAVGAHLDDNFPVHLSGLPQGILDELGSLSGTYLKQSLTLYGTSSSFVEIPNIPMESSFTYVAFVWIEADQAGPLWQWDHPSLWHDHIWYMGTSREIFYRQTDRYGNLHDPAAAMGMLHNNLALS